MKKVIFCVLTFLCLAYSRLEAQSTENTSFIPLKEVIILNYDEATDQKVFECLLSEGNKKFIKNGGGGVFSIESRIDSAGKIGRAVFIDTLAPGVLMRQEIVFMERQTYVFTFLVTNNEEFEVPSRVLFFQRKEILRRLCGIAEIKE